jgi:hypothetical protein
MAKRKAIVVAVIAKKGGVKGTMAQRMAYLRSLKKGKKKGA